MKHYINTNNQIFAFDDTQLHLVTADMREISNQELAELLAPTPEQLTQQAKSAVYAFLDQTAQQFDYRNMAEVTQFVQSGTWKAEADALLAWQDAVWLKAYELLKEPIESVDDFVAQLPKFEGVIK
jgi:hypothetical protein